MEAFRYWLASKIIGKPIYNLKEKENEWIKKQLSHGNKVTLEFEVNTLH